MVRKLRPEEWELWRTVADTAIPIQAALSVDQKPLGNSEVKNKEFLEKSFVIKGFKVGQTSVLPAQAKIAITPQKQHHKMDTKSFGKLIRGKIKPEAVIDLHGMTMSEAHPELRNFILGSAQLQRRLVLVITGKGKPKTDYGRIPERHGVLRHNVPIWLLQPPLSAVILDVTDAHQRHGGGGAIYVFLKKQR
jgi:DNA-nicking Smr family endonuclease